MEVQQNISLKPYNTFGIDVPAEYFMELNDIDTLPQVTDLPYQKRVLGGGSNILLTQAIKGLVVYNRAKGIAIEREDENFVWIRVQSGEIWNDFVLHAI